VLDLEKYSTYDFAIPLIDFDRKYPYDTVLDDIVTSVAPLGAQYQDRMRQGFSGGWLDVYENEGKRSGAYSAPVYGVHPYMLLNYTNTLDDVFTLAHEMGHSMHTMLSHEAQPFIYSSYTIFVAEVPSTLSEALLLDHLLRKTTDARERVVLLQHAIDNITSTFYTQVMFADFELQAHRMVERDEPITSDILNELYLGLMRDYYGDAVDIDPLAAGTWARIPHFFNTPYYVYQYATCFASAAQLAKEIPAARNRYLQLLAAGGSDYPMELLKRAGVDLSKPDTVRAVIDQLDGLVSRLEEELARL
jgi:oligoendopeptidase F